MISSAIHNLENALGGVRLFEKAGRNIRLTDEGRYYQENVDEAIHLLHQASMTLRDSRTQAPIVIRMSVVSGTVDGFLAREIVNMSMFLLYSNPRRHIFVLARVIVIVNSGPKKADGVNQRIVIPKVIAALRESRLCSYTAVAYEQDFYHTVPSLS